MLEKGVSVSEIVKKMVVHERTVYRVKEKNYLALPLIDYIEQQERKENEQAENKTV